MGPQKTATAVLDVKRGSLCLAGCRRFHLRCKRHTSMNSCSLLRLRFNGQLATDQF